MRKYIAIIIGGKSYRFLIDEELDKALKSSLKERYKFDDSDTLIIDEDDLVNSYNLKQLILKSLLNQINTYDLSQDLQRKIDSLKDYIGSKTNVYSSDVSKLDSILGEASEIYNSVRNNFSKIGATKESKERIKDNLKEDSNIANTSDYVKDTENDDYKIDNIITASSSEEALLEFKTIVEEISEDEDLSSEVSITNINDAINRIESTSTEAEFVSKTGGNADYNVKDAINNKNAKIILPPNVKVENVVAEIIRVNCANEETVKKVISYVERKAIYKNKTDGALEKLRSSLKVSGFSARNLNYFGDQFFDAFESICRESGMSFDKMFADYFNSYSANRKYNSPIDKFIRMFNKFNGGNADTTALLEAMLVKKAISRGLISYKFNRSLRQDMQNLNVSRSGYINFNENSFSNTIGGISSGQAHSVNIASEGHLDNNSNSYQSDINAGSAGSGDKDKKPESPLNNVQNKIDNDSQEPQIDSVNPTSFKVNKKNQARVGALGVRTARVVTTENQTNARAIGAVGRRFASNTSLNPTLLLDEDDLIDDDSHEDLDGNTDTSLGDNNLGSRISDNDLNDDDNLEDENPNELSEAPGLSEGTDDEPKKDKRNKLIEFLKKNPWTWGAIGLCIFVLFLFLIIIATSNNDKGMNGSMGYYDAACDYNDTKVTIMDCVENKTLANLDLEDYVTKMAYLYIKDNDYSDETIKALMIILKTNALSLGGYSSNNKDITVRICDVYNGIIEENSLFDGVDSQLETLNSLYEEVNEYLFISSSYKSSISSLSRANAITIDDNILSALESVAMSGAKYNEILDSVFAVDTEENITIDNVRENLFLGDSRTQGIINTGVINESNTVYGVGYGYNWLVGDSGFNGTTNASNGGINAINSKIVSGKLYNIIIWLGVNDLDNDNSYLEKYIELASGEWSGHNIYVVSVGPVQDSKSKYAKNEKITSFNNTIKEGIKTANLSNLKYIDLEYTESSINSYDNAGIHYGKEDYKIIYNKIISNLSGNSGPSVISSKLSLYRLSDYCTYYMLTENDAFWWPIGSKDSTNGDIYGGEPTTTTITSPFGPRVINGVSSNHGGVDISGGSACYSNVIIAAKSGTVTSSNDTCPTVGSYGNKCGGGYGNYVIIDHGDGTSTVYAHMSSDSVVVKVGDTVKQGQKIGIMGSSGSSTGCHLHFEVRLDGTKVNPLNYINAENTRPSNFAVSNIDGGIIVVGDNGDYSNSSRNKSVVCKSLKASGFSDNATIGILTNMQRESASTFSPEIVEFGSGYNFSNIYSAPASVAAGFGIVQWSFGRRIELIDYAKEKNIKPASMVAQLNFFYYEVTEKSSYSVTEKYITGSYSGYDTAVAFCKNFERPKGSVRDLNTKDSCTNRADQIVPNMTTYVKNGCID